MNARINVSDFDLVATLECGQAFRWERAPDAWFTGVVGRRILRVRQDGAVLTGDVDPHYFSLDRSLPDIAATFPDDPALREAVKKHWGLRVLRQEPWETLASFIASSTKQIIQIRQIIRHLAERFGEPVGDAQFSFPTCEAIARASEQQLRGCRLGFRAKYLLAAARAIDSGTLPLSVLSDMEYRRALEELLKLPGVGLKIANCVLLFSCGHDEAFPVDVWVARALRRVKSRQSFGPYAGWAQQYLFFNERHRGRA